MTSGQFFQKYLKDNTIKEEDIVYSGEMCFESSGVTGIEQCELVKTGKKTCCFTAFESFDINLEPLPVVGEIYVVENTEEKPFCIIELDDVKVLPFKEVSWEMARQEGEDQNLEEWRDKQREYMEEEAALCGFDFTDESLVVFEHFHVIYK